MQNKKLSLQWYWVSPLRRTVKLSCKIFLIFIFWNVVYAMFCKHSMPRNIVNWQLISSYAMFSPRAEEQEMWTLILLDGFFLNTFVRKNKYFSTVSLICKHFFKPIDLAPAFRWWKESCLFLDLNALNNFISLLFPCFSIGDWPEDLTFLNTMDSTLKKVVKQALRCA